MFAKVVASFQAAWLVAQVVARGIQHLSVTLLELSTIALITCTGAALLFWFNKPLNVETPTTLELEFSVTEILVRAGKSADALSQMLGCSRTSTSTDPK